MELRCGNGILHGVLTEGVLEVACKSARCGKRPGNVVIHRFNINTGSLLDTRVFLQPTPKEVNSNANRSEQGSALWAS